jgi:hypothetical protein
VPKPISIPLIFAVACVGFVGQAIGGRVVYGIAFVAIAVIAAWEWASLRESDRPPADIADRLGLHLAAFALILALPGLDMIGDWIVASLGNVVASE